MALYEPAWFNRRSIRLKHYDYSNPGIYFVTICAKDRKEIFGAIASEEIILTELGKIAQSQWDKLPDRFPHIRCREFQIMPNHIHLIVQFKKRNQSKLIPTGERESLGKIIGAYKSLVTHVFIKKQTHGMKYDGKIWQRNFYDHVVEDRESYIKIRKYIADNPQNWKHDKFYKYEKINGIST
ncbi:MAG: transposase [Fusobacteriaceae bacterium]|nr:transposase [Fusobacteriaceae bacterium]